MNHPDGNASSHEALTEGMLEIRHVADSDQAREAYDELYGETQIDNLVQHLNWLLDISGAQAGERLLDIACGRGDLVRIARDRGLEAQGVDLSSVALAAGRYAHRLAEGQLVAGDGTNLPVASDSIDLVTSVGSLEHYDDMLDGVKEMARVLSPTGRACILVPNSFGLRWNVIHAWRHGDIHDDGQPIQRYATRMQWQRLFEAGCLQVDEVLGCESVDDFDLGEGLAGAAKAISEVFRHPSRALIPFSKWMPVDMASMLVFLCRPAA